MAQGNGKSGGGGGSGGGGVTPFIVLPFSLTHTGGGTASVQVNVTTTTTFTARNLGASSVTASFVVTACSGALKVNSCTVSPGSATLAPDASTTVTAHFTGGAAAGNGTLTIAAKNGSSTLATSSVAVTVQPPASGPVLSTALNPGDLIDVSACVADCFESTFGYATLAYVSRDVPRAVQLLYRSGRARPMGRVIVDATDASLPSGSAFRLQLANPSGGYVTFTNGSTSLYFAKASTGATRLAAEFDAGAVPTSAGLYTAYVTSYAPTGVQGGTTAATVRLIIINDLASVAGAGVEIVGLQRVFTAQSGGVLVTDGSGSASFFAGNCSLTGPLCSYTSPAGDFSTLSTRSGTYQRIYLDGSILTFNGAGEEISAADRYGSTTSYVYVLNSDAGKDVLASITDPAGQVSSFTYRNAGNANGWKVGTLGAITSVGARSSNFGISAANELKAVAEPDGVWFASLTYDAQHRLLSYQDRGNNTWNYTHSYGRTLDYVDAPAVVVSGGSSVRPRQRARETAWELFSAAATGSGKTQATAIAVATQPAELIDPGGHSTKLTLDRWNEPLTVTDALNQTTTITRDALGRPTQVQRPTGAVDAFSYVGANLVMARYAGADSTNYRWGTKWVLPPGAATSIPVTVLDSVWGLRQPWQHVIYNAANASVQSVQSKYSQPDATVFTTQYVTDSYGRITSVTDAAGHVTRVFYNGRYGNADSTVEHGGQWAKTVYDVFGRDSLSSASGLTVPPPDGPLQPVKTLYDALNRVVSVQEGWRTPVTVEYGPVLPTKVRDRAAQVFRRDYNALGWVTAEYDPADTTSWSRYVRYEYDVEGELARRTNRRAQAILTTYDVLHRPTSVTSPTSADYFGYSADGLRSAAWNALSTDSSYFRADGWRDSVVTRIGGRRFRTRYLPDAYQRLDSIDISMGGSPITFVGRKYLYDPTQNVLKTIRFGNSFGATLSRNNEGMVTGITYLMANGGVRNRVLNFTSTHQLFKDYVPSLWRSPQFTNGSYTEAVGYDSVGRIREETPVPDAALFVNTFAYKGARLDTHLRAYTVLPTTVPWPSCPAPDANYGYNCSALITAGKPYNQARYGVDAADNRVNDFRSGIDDAGASFSATTSYGFDPGDRVRTASGPGPYGSGDNLAPFTGAALTFERDLDGNLTRRYGSSTDVRYGWDALGRLTSVTVAATGAIVNYDYNALGQLVRRRTNGTIDRHFLWQGDNLLAELDGAAGSRIAEYVHWGLDQPLAVLTGSYTLGEVNYAVQDAKGECQAAFRSAAGGASLSRN